MDGEPLSPEGTREGKGDLSSSGHPTAASSHRQPWGSPGCEHTGY